MSLSMGQGFKLLFRNHLY